MAIVADSGAVFGLYDRRDANHRALKSAIETDRDVIIIPVGLMGEIDHFLRTRLGNRALLHFLEDIQRGAFQMEPLHADDISRCRQIVGKYDGMNLGICDALVAAVADRLGTNQILTVDQRDFRILRTPKGSPYRLLPADLRKGDDR